MSKDPARRGKVRDNLEAFGIAILAAVLLKYFAIEAYQIPTSSMQPTLMGSVEANVHDRILVDKVRYAITDPDRWDVAVFRYPLQQNQNYVKRLVGMPGDRLVIKGGNLYRVDEQDEIVEPLRKPAHIQERLWKNVYPLRRQVMENTEILGEYFTGQGDWRQDGEDLVVDAGDRRLSLLTFSKNADSGLVNQVFDGYPVDVARMIRSAAGTGAEFAVQDVRLSMDVTPGRWTADSEMEMQLEVDRPARDRLRFILHIEGGEAQLLVKKGSALAVAHSLEAFPFELTDGEVTSVAFAHLDDELIAWRDGEELARLDTSEYRILDGLETPSAKVTPGIQIRGGGETRLSELRVERDLHYTRSTLARDHVIEVPAGHYFMMGDNTLQSVDSRDWTAIVVGRQDGMVVDPITHPEAELVRGNRRPVEPSKPVDRDETPIAIPSAETLVMIDEFGNVLRMKTGFNRDYMLTDPSQILLEPLNGDEVWIPEEVKVPFVPREHIIGRALMGFWPLPPFGPNRVGFIR